MFYKEIQNHFDSVAPKRKYWEDKNSYYYKQLIKFISTSIPAGKKVLEIGCGRGSLLKSCSPSFALGIDISPKMIEEAKKNFPQGNFAVMDASSMGLKEKFDFIILSDVLGNLYDIQRTLEEVRNLCCENTRIIVTYYNYIYEPLFRTAEHLKFKMPQPRQSWLSFHDINSFLKLAAIDVIQNGRIILFPKNIPGISWFMNRYFSQLPILNHFCTVQYFIGKPERAFLKRDKPYSVSVIVPSRNEQGNIEDIVKRIPNFGDKSDISAEIIFVEGGSTDDTAGEICRVKEKYSHKNIKFYTQEGKGKADADYKGMDNATGDIFMILDADMTVPPEELTKFYKTMKGSNADLVMGSRLVYPMEKGAMRFLNLLGNKFFSTLISWLIGQRVKDTLCGTKVLFKEKYLELKKRNPDLIKLDPFGDFFFILGTARNTGKIVEIPIRYRERTYGSTNISRFRHGFYLLKMCWYAARKLKFK